jgi:hypothetical protein
MRSGHRSVSRLCGRAETNPRAVRIDLSGQHDLMIQVAKITLGEMRAAGLGLAIYQ